MASGDRESIEGGVERLSHESWARLSRARSPQEHDGVGGHEVISEPSEVRSEALGLKSEAVKFGRNDSNEVRSEALGLKREAVKIGRNDSNETRSEALRLKSEALNVGRNGVDVMSELQGVAKKRCNEREPAAVSK